MASRALLTTVVVVLLLHQPLADAGGEAGATDEELQYRRHRRRFHHHRDTPQTPTTPVQPVQPVHPPPPPPARQRCNDTSAPEESITASGDVCVTVPAPSPPVPLPPPHGLRCPPCTCKRPPQQQPPRPFPFTGWPVPRPLPVPGRGPGSNAGADSGDAAYDCVTPLAPLMACGGFVTGNQTDTPTPNSQCCSALAAFLRTSSAAAAAGRGDHMLRCLCPVILGEVNRVLTKPVDPVRLMFLPIACGVVLPPQLLYLCFAGQPTPAVDRQPLP